MKRLTKEGWRVLGVRTSRDLCQRGGRGIYVSYIPSDFGREARFACWRVYRPGYETDPHGHWSDGRNKTFTVHSRGDKEAKRLEAIEWAVYVYNITGEWERDPWGGWHPAGTLEAARVASVTAQASPLT